MRRLLPVLATVLVVAQPAVAAAAEPRKGPAGTAFYTPPSPLPGKAHGDLIWARKITRGAALPTAAANYLVLYRSTGSDGKPIAVSGTVALPEGKAPKGGFKTVSWTHGTSGIADKCAPSRDDGKNVAHAYQSYTSPLLSSWLERGYAVVRTDYQGLGTPGTHEYLGGESEARSALDIVRAARQLDGRISTSYALAGHSQGGHAALWAAALTRKWTPELKLRGTLAFAPASHIAEQAALIGALTAPRSGFGGLVALVVGGLDAQHPELNVQSELSDRARELFPQIGRQCLVELGGMGSFGGIAPADIFKPGAVLGPAVAAIEKNDPENLTITGAPITIEQGEADAVVSPNLTNPLVDELRSRGAKITYTKYPGADHMSVVTTAATKHATSFIVKRLK
jgi:pimeloyl-ACP methyl ester carboxylesterase